MRPAIPYYRVSTRVQGASGLGLEAQKEAVIRYMSANEFEPLAEFTEIESGRRKNRPELTKALEVCRKQKATLIIAKLDRLARNVHFVSSLMEAKVDFIAVDNPQANKLMLHMLAAFAEHESDLIRTRIKEALAAAKRRGVELGKNGKVLATQNKAKADEFALSIMPYLHTKNSLRGWAKMLNKMNVPSFRGRQWHSNSLYRISARLKEEQSN